MRARSTRPAGSVRERAIDLNRANSALFIDNSTCNRGAAMTSTSYRESEITLPRSVVEMNPHRINFMESLN
jgi:hypothetical protein